MTPGHEADTLDECVRLPEALCFHTDALARAAGPRLSPMLSTGHKVLWRVYKKDQVGALNAPVIASDREKSAHSTEKTRRDTPEQISPRRNAVAISAAGTDGIASRINPGLLYPNNA
jgi:hypothetical protein